MKIFKPIIEDLATFSGSVDITGSLTVTQNLEVQGDITASGNIIPSVSGAFDLGTPELPFRDIYVSQNSLKFISTESGEEIGRISVNKNTGDIKLLNTKKLTPQQRASLTGETVIADALSPVSASALWVSESISPGHTNTSIGHTNQKFHTLHTQFVSASSSTISGSLHVGDTVIASTFTGSFVGDGTQLTGVTSYTDSDTLSYINTVGVISSSAQIASDISGSFTSVSASLASSIAGISTDFTDITNKPTLLSGSNQLAGETIDGDLTLTGMLTAQTLHVQEVTSSIVYSSGSNVFGSSAGDVQQFTGSLNITGNVSTLGTLTASGYNSSNWDTAFSWGNHTSAGYATQGYVTTALSGAIFTDSNASLNGLTTADLSVSNGAVLDGGISSIGTVGDRYAITTGGANSLYISNTSSPPYSIFEVNNNYIRFINGSSGSSITLTENSIGASNISINNVDGYLVFDEGGNFGDNGGFVKLSSTRCEFKTHFDGSASNNSNIFINQNPTNGSAYIEHSSNNINASFGTSTNGQLNFSSGRGTGFFSPIGFVFSGSGVTIYSDLSVSGNITCRNITSIDDVTSGRDIISDGRVVAAGDVVAFSSSDKRLKDNIEQIPNAIDKIQSISGYSFNWNDKQDTYEVGGRDIGVVAQEIEEVLPELVTTRDSGYKAVKYEKIVALLIEGIKEQQEQINELKTKLDGITN